MLLDLFTLASPNIPRLSPKFYTNFEAVIKPFSAAEQQFSTFTPFGVFAAVTQNNTAFAQQIETILKRYQEQPFSGFTPSPRVPVSTVFFQPAEIITRPRLITPQEFSQFEPEQVTFTITGWQSEQPIITIKGVNVSLLEFTNVDQLFAAAIATSGPVFSQSPDIFILQFNPVNQQFTAFEPLGNVPTPSTPYGWMEQQPNAEIFIKALNVAQQQFGAFEPLGFIQPPPVSTKKPAWLVIARRRGKR